ncbi:hypothetical protein RUM44_001981 [Polyplax serrata]|uniref:Ribosome biogenesis protein NOP53 n=1 Tax=Polyplax serrata TaxID=468196 RepID=A0ABR1ALX4_POLSC
MSTKRKRVSKKSKKSWRKNVDISDVDNFIQDQLLQERLGVNYSEQNDEDLFEIDTTGNEEYVCIDNKAGKIVEPEKPKSDVENYPPSMRLRETKLPKCFEILEKRTAVPAAIAVKKGVKPSRLRHKGLRRKLEVQSETSLKKKEKKPGVLFNYDVWSKETETEKKIDDNWLTSDTVRHTLQNTGLHKKQIPKTIFVKPSLLPAVEVPHPGLSYNPSLRDHNDILSKVAEKELEIIKEEKHLNRVTRNMFSQVTREKMEKDWLSEMTVGLTMTKEESDIDDGEQYKALNPPVRNKKKTLQKRRKQKEALKLKEKLKNQKIEKKKLSDIYKLRIFNESISKKEQRIMKNIEKRKEKKLQRPYKTKSLSQIKYKEPELDFLLPDELSGNLRNIKPEGNLLFERFKSLQKRNILQPTIKRHVSRSKGKAYEREHTKMGWEKMESQMNKRSKKK